MGKDRKQAKVCLNLPCTGIVYASPLKELLQIIPHTVQHLILGGRVHMRVGELVSSKDLAICVKNRLAFRQVKICVTSKGEGNLVYSMRLLQVLLNYAAKFNYEAKLVARARMPFINAYQ